jgi:hypothetical protein
LSGTPPPAQPREIHKTKQVGGQSWRRSREGNTMSIMRKKPKNDVYGEFLMKSRIFKI